MYSMRSCQWLLIGKHRDAALRLPILTELSCLVLTYAAYIADIWQVLLSERLDGCFIKTCGMRLARTSQQSPSRLYLCSSIWLDPERHYIYLPQLPCKWNLKAEVRSIWVSRDMHSLWDYQASLNKQGMCNTSRQSHPFRGWGTINKERCVSTFGSESEV